MPHALQRALDRCARFGMDADTVLRRVRPYKKLSGSHAVCVGRRDDITKIAAHDNSNGDTLWCIIREGCLVTVMLRRTNQPLTPEAFHVDTVHFAV